MTADQPRATVGREGRVIGAARAIAIDYRSIVENALSGLVHNTKIERGGVYVRARSSVRRQLELMRLPDSVVELEELSLDLTIKKIERECQAIEAAAQAAAPPKRAPRARTIGESLTALAGAVGALGQAVAGLIVLLGLRPVVSAVALITRPVRALLRGLFSPVGVAAALPIVAMAIFFIFFVDNNIAYRSLVNGPAGRWLAQLDLLPSAPAPAVRSKPAQTPTPPSLASGGGPGSGLRSVRSADPLPQLAAADTGSPDPSTDAGSYRGPTRVRPMRADLVGAPAPPPPTDSACDGCARQNAAQLNASGARNGLPAWVTGYAAVNPVPQLPLAATGWAPRSADQPIGRSSDAITPAGESAATPSAVPPQGATAPIARPANAKIAALVDTGKRAAAKGDLDRAVQTFTEAIRIDPKFPDSYSERGQALFKLGETERAIADYSAAIQRNPQHGAALRARGMAYLYRGSNDLALADLSRAIDLAANDPSLMAPIELFYARRSRATIYGSRLQYDQEIADCTALIESYLRDPSVTQALKEAYRDVGAGNVVATIYRQRATAHIRQSHFELAIADLTAAIPLSADGGYSALIDRSKLNESLGQRDQAIADLQNALAVRPSSEEARVALKRLGATPKPVRAI
jgi:tetratricopeptide (TPR) repeat protein